MIKRQKEQMSLSDEEIVNKAGEEFAGFYLRYDIKEFVKWVEQEIILKSPKARQNLIKLKERVGDKLI